MNIDDFEGRTRPMGRTNPSQRNAEAARTKLQALDPCCDPCCTRAVAVRLLGRKPGARAGIGEPITLEGINRRDAKIVEKGIFWRERTLSYRSRSNSEG